MSDQILQCKTCGARVLQTVHPGIEPVACPKCKSLNWVEIRGYHSAREDDPDWLGSFLGALGRPGHTLRWR